MFQIELRVAQGVNFPYYAMGKAQLRIPPFSDPWVWIDAQTDPYDLFAREYGAENSEIEGTEEIWYSWLSQVSFRCPDSARESLRYCDGALLRVAKGVLPEYTSRWGDLCSKLASAAHEVSRRDLSAVVRRNEQLFGLSYPEGGREAIHLNHFPTMAAQKVGRHFMFGLGCLSQPALLLRTIESEIGLSLLEQVLVDGRVASFLHRIEEVTERDRYVQGNGSLLEALNGVIRAIEKRGASVTLDDVPRKPGEEGYQQIADSLFRNRRLWPESGLIDFVCASLDELR